MIVDFSGLPQRVGGGVLVSCPGCGAEFDLRGDCAAAVACLYLGHVGECAGSGAFAAGFVHGLVAGTMVRDVQIAEEFARRLEGVVDGN